MGRSILHAILSQLRKRVDLFVMTRSRYQLSILKGKFPVLLISMQDMAYDDDDEYNPSTAWQGTICIMHTKNDDVDCGGKSGGFES